LNGSESTISFNNHAKELAKADSCDSYVSTKDLSSPSDNKFEESNKSLVENLKGFFAQKFRTKSQSNKIKAACFMKQLSSSSLPRPQKNEVEPLPNYIANGSCHSSSCFSKPTEMTNSFKSINNLTESDSIERFRQIIEDYKNVLPKDFIVRKFPNSSCQNTFHDSSNEQKHDNFCGSLEINNHKNYDSIEFSKTPSPAETSTSELSLSQGFLETNSILEKNNDNQSQSDLNSEKKDYLENEINVQNDSKKSKEQDEDEELDDQNTDNKRFYHVFKKNELDCLIKEYCQELIIYDSYYDHGNWCICALKKHETTA
jgi:hypothetical protein